MGNQSVRSFDHYKSQKMHLRSILIILGLFLFQPGNAQSIVGQVKDAKGVPLPSASVIVDGTNGQFADIDGRFNFQLQPGTHEVRFSFIGYISQNRTVELAGEDIEFNIVLEEDAVMIDDVVVVGYGVQRKKEVTGSIVQVSSKQITGIQTPSFEAALQGQAAGVQVSQSSGVAGAPSLIRVRGVASVSAAGDPLYVVDGIPITQEYFLRGNSGAMNNNPLAAINPNDIESVEILKDAAATGIYGSRGANGVILITTKRGKKGTAFEFSTRAGFGIPATRPNMMDTETYLALRQEAWENDGGTGYVWLPNMSSAGDDPATRQAAYMQAMNTQTDWVDETTGRGTKGAINFGVRQGGDRYNLYAGVSKDNNSSYLLGNSYNRSSGRVNFDWKPNSWATVVLSTSLSRGENNRIDAAWSGGMGDAMSNALPYYPVRYEEDVLDANGNVAHSAGEYFLWFDEWGGTKNPVAIRELKKWKTTEDRSISNAQLILTPIEDLHVKLSGGFDYLHLREDVFNPGALSITSELGSANRYANYVLNWNYSATVDYRWELDDTQAVNFLAGSEFQRTDNYGYGLYYGNVEGPIFESDSLSQEAANVNRTVNLPSQHSFLSYFGRVNYSLKDRYFLQATARVDGSSRFGRESRYGFFPSLSAGWVMSDEEWFNSENISFMKVRSSIGFTGNAALPDYARFGTYSASNNGTTYAGDSILYPIQPENPTLRWETSRTIDASIEMGLWQDRITFELAGYHKYSTDVLMNVSTPASTGFTNFWDNVGTILNRGVELSIKSRNLVGEFQWNTDLNVARNYNELIDIGDYTPDAVSGGTNDSRVIVGRPIGSFYLVEHSHVDPETGLPVYLDLDGNETYDYNNDIRKYVGDGLPDIIGGMNNTFRYKNWDLSALATFSIGAKIFDSSAKRQLGVVTGWNMREEKLDRWRQPGDEATYPLLTLDETTYSLPSGFPWWNTSLFIYDASYVRLRNLTIGYNVPLQPGSAMTNCRIAFNATNVFTITNFPGLDPEVVRDFENAQDRNMSPNVTYLTPPQERAFTLSISTNF
jgi:TonB-dependent starch-binding outer membrane protein SusC